MQLSQPRHVRPPKADGRDPQPLSASSEIKPLEQALTLAQLIVITGSDRSFVSCARQVEMTGYVDHDMRARIHFPHYWL